MRLRQSRARRQGTAPTVCPGRLSGAAGVRGSGSSGWGEVQGWQERAVGGGRGMQGMEAQAHGGGGGGGGCFLMAFGQLKCLRGQNFAIIAKFKP